MPRDPWSVARAPTRIDLAGGTLDIWPLSVLTEDALTVNVALSLRAEARARPRRDGALRLTSHDLGVTSRIPRGRRPRAGARLELLERLARALGPSAGVDLETRAAVPAGSGLGGSSALAVAAAAALARTSGRRLGRDALLRLVRDHETRVLGSPAGEQDYVAAIHGGVSALHLEPGGHWREAVDVDAAALEARLVLVYSGRSRFSGAGNWAILRRRVEGDRAIARRLAEIARAAGRLHRALARGDWSGAASAMRAEWSARRKLVPEVAAGGVDGIIRAGLRGGALAGKVCGAGGGGCLAFLVPPGRRETLARRLEAGGLTRLPARVARRGVTVSSSPPGRAR